MLSTHTCIFPRQDNIASLLASDLTSLRLTLRLEPGKSLNKYVDALQRCTLSHSEGETVLRQMAGALSHLHGRRLVHDDVKPENIMWDPVERRAVLVDFGAALNLAVLPEGYFNPSGTPSYAPPEFLHRRKGPKGDVWALGIVMFYAWGHVELPDGAWLLPAVWDEGGDIEMRKWLGEMGRLGEIERKKGTVLGQMLQEDPQERIDSVELTRGLS